MSAPPTPESVARGEQRIGPATLASRFVVRAWLLGGRLDVRALERGDTVALAPLTVKVGERGYAVLFRYGAVVLVDLSPVEEATFVAGLASFVRDAFEDPEREEVEIAVDPSRHERVDATGTLYLREASVERLQVVSVVLAKSTVLAHYEDRVAEVFDRIEQLASSLQRGERRPAIGRDLLRQIGDVLLTQTRTVGRVEVTEKPEITWDQPELDRLYERLSLEYELRDRDLALARKLELVSRTAETYLDLLQNRQALRVEWYIVILIAVEIVLIVYDILA